MKKEITFHSLDEILGRARELTEKAQPHLQASEVGALEPRLENGEPIWPGLDIAAMAVVYMARASQLMAWIGADPELDPILQEAWLSTYYGRQVARTTSLNAETLDAVKH